MPLTIDYRGYICDNDCVLSVFWNINVIYCITDIHETAIQLRESFPI